MSFAGPSDAQQPYLFLVLLDDETHVGLYHGGAETIYLPKGRHGDYLEFVAIPCPVNSVAGKLIPLCSSDQYIKAPSDVLGFRAGTVDALAFNLYNCYNLIIHYLSFGTGNVSDPVVSEAINAFHANCRGEATAESLRCKNISEHYVCGLDNPANLTEGFWSS